jgi:hypothetical protein
MPQRSLAAFLRRFGILPGHTFPLQVALRLGFCCAGVWRSGNNQLLDNVDDVERWLAKVGLHRSTLVSRDGSWEWLNAIRVALNDEGKDVPIWFNLGYYCYGATWILVEKGVLFEAEHGRLIETDDARRYWRGDPEVRKSMSNLIAELIDAGHSPAEAETFCVENVLPFLWSHDLRKWVHRVEMAPMQDLAHFASRRDDDLNHFVIDRARGGARGLLEIIPYAGKAIGNVLLGPDRRGR